MSDFKIIKENGNDLFGNKKYIQTDLKTENQIEAGQAIFFFLITNLFTGFTSFIIYKIKYLLSSDKDNINDMKLFMKCSFYSLMLNLCVIGFFIFQFISKGEHYHYVNGNPVSDAQAYGENFISYIIFSLITGIIISLYRLLKFLKS
jgi:NADH:ubiquinone oxidoreductase subunit 5 (subunit L)/multisubunit Na+/H+ antiporter MnhA subunit